MEFFYSGLLGFNFFYAGELVGGGGVKEIFFYLLKFFFKLLQ